MTRFSISNISSALHDYESYNKDQLEIIIQTLNNISSYSNYLQQVTKKEQALINQQAAQEVLLHSIQEFPEVIKSTEISITTKSLKDTAIMITAGGEGERLRVSLEELGYPKNDLVNFTKATFPIPQTDFSSGALEVNLTGIRRLADNLNIDIPVVVTTGPSGSTTADYIPSVLTKNKNFGIKNLRVLMQDERFHLSDSNKIVITHWNMNSPVFATNPDETGGPIEKLSYGGPKSVLAWLEGLDVKKIIILQGTAVYEPNLVTAIASASELFEVLGVGISRSNFLPTDPYGTFVVVNNAGAKKLLIAEKDVRSKETEELFNKKQQIFLPFNTGFYAIKLSLLKQNSLADYASPNKIITKKLPPAPKIGYAATQILEFSEKCGVLTIPEDSFKVIKNADDLIKLSETVKKFNLTK